MTAAEFVASVTPIRAAPRVTLGDTSNWPDSPPEVPAQPGWTFYVFPMRDRQGQWKVNARKGSKSLGIDRLTSADVRTFDAEDRWARS